MVAIVLYYLFFTKKNCSVETYMNGPSHPNHENQE